MAHIAERWGLIPELRSFAEQGMPIWGTCAGLIFLADRASGQQLSQRSLPNMELKWLSMVPLNCPQLVLKLFDWLCRPERGRAGAAGGPGLQGAQKLLWSPDQLVRDGVAGAAGTASLPVWASGLPRHVHPRSSRPGGWPLCRGPVRVQVQLVALTLDMTQRNPACFCSSQRDPLDLSS